VASVADVIGAALGAIGARAAQVATQDETVVEMVAIAIAKADDLEWGRLKERKQMRYRRLAAAALESFAQLTGQGVRSAVESVAAMQGQRISDLR